MKRYPMADLGASVGERVGESLLPGAYIQSGGLSFHAAGFRTHPEGAHTHDSAEMFVILQGRGRIEIDGASFPIQAGDVIVVEAGEEHHLVGDMEHPIVNLWLHCANERHPNQTVFG